MTARLRRIAADWEQVRKDFVGHKNIIVTPVEGNPPEKYRVTYFVNGIYLLPDGKIEVLARHEVEITLHSEYPRYKPICKISTQIWHPNFRDGQICIGDIWGAGESLSDIIINIGDMIQYKSWNSSSPLSSEAAQWAIENKHLFPIGSIDLHIADYSSANGDVSIDLYVDDAVGTDETSRQEFMMGTPPVVPTNDFDIAAEELAGIEFVPTAQRMQTVAHGGLVRGNSVNFKTILFKGIIWAFIGAIFGFVISESLNAATSSTQALKWMGYSDVAEVYEKLMNIDESSDLAERLELYRLYSNILLSKIEFNDVMKSAVRVSSAMFAALLALGLGLFLGIGEGIYYGSKPQAVRYALIGAGISIVIGFVSGYIAQATYAGMLSDDASTMASAMVRGFGWSIMGLGVGVSIGLIKPELRRLMFCSLGGLAGGFLGGFIFNFVVGVVKFGANDTGTFARAIGITVMGLLIGLGIGLLEQFAKQAWLKVVRGEFEGKEYLVFAGTTSIGNNGKNTIVLFKDSLVAPHHCDIVLDGSKYVLIDQGTPLGTIVNGMKTARCILKQGDAIAVGNSVLVFNTK
ncbi:MAG: FHA domain-containing protein [Synergistaceae bacterium]|jgi:ubiquitin-protein ligase|nr:FHA domain-containing protein [Synergistaceae bacterium]